MRKAKLGAITATKANLEFKLPKHDHVNEIHLTFEAPLNTVLTAMDSAYGKHTEDEEYFYWQRGGNETIKLFKSRRNTTYVTIDYDVSVGASRKKNLINESQKKRELKNF